jgi:hypothetical protein
MRTAIERVDELELLQLVADRRRPSAGSERRPPSLKR